MDAEPLNPYRTPAAGELLAPGALVDPEAKPPLPPLSRIRLAIALALMTGVVVAIWFAVNEGQFYCIIVATICGNEISRMLDPHDLRFASKSLHSFLWKLAGTGVFIAFSFVWILWQDQPVVSAVLQHAVSYGTAWLVGCGMLLRDWWKRRNNPLYPPMPHLERSWKSLWKPLPRAQDL